MPEREVVLKRSKAYGTKLDSLFAIKIKAYQFKIEEFKKASSTLNDSIKKNKIQELTGLEKDIQKYKQNGNQLMQLRNDELMRPLYKKLREVIAEISKANNFTQILTITGNEFAYIDEKFDITKLVMDKLGIKETVKK